MLPAQGCDFGCQIDTYRAPGDTPATTNTTQSIELDLPAGHFMRQPLAIPSADIWTGIPTIYIAVIGIEARIPDTFSPARLAGQVRTVLDIPAKARWADLGAIGATEAALADRIPVWMFHVIN